MRQAVQGVEERGEPLEFTDPVSGRAAVPELAQQGGRGAAEQRLRYEGGEAGSSPGRNESGVRRARAGSAYRGTCSPRVSTERPVARPRAWRSIQAAE